MACDPFNVFQPLYDYGLLQSWEETPVDVAKIRMEIRFNLVGLPANSNCTVSIMAKPSQGGFWGPSETHSFKTLESGFTQLYSCIS